MRVLLAGGLLRVLARLIPAPGAPSRRQLEMGTASDGAGSPDGDSTGAGVDVAGGGDSGVGPAVAVGTGVDVTTGVGSGVADGGAGVVGSAVASGVVSGAGPALTT